MEVLTMRKQLCLLISFSLCIVLVMVFSGCAGDDDNGSPTSPGTVLVERDVTVPGGGGTADVTFSGSSGQNIRITLTASPNVEPYGYLTYPDGEGEYYPELQTAQNGANSVELTLNQTGTYTLGIMDGTNQGGTVHVKVEVI